MPISNDKENVRRDCFLKQKVHPSGLFFIASGTEYLYSNSLPFTYALVLSFLDLLLFKIESV